MARMTHEDLPILEASLATSYGISDAANEEFLRRSGVNDVEAMLDRATDATYRNVSLSDIASAVIELEDPSWRGPWKGAALINKWREISAMRGYDSIHASSTISLPGTLSRLANKAMLQGYSDAPQVLRSIAMEMKGNDYKQHSMYRAQMAGTLEEVGPSGEIKSTAMSETEYSLRPTIRAKDLAVPEQHLVDDDLGAFLSAANEFGAMGQRTIELELAAHLAEASTTAGAQSSGEFFFGSGVGADNRKPNYFEGASSALDIDSLATAENMLRGQTDKHGDPIELSGTHLLCIGSNLTKARSIYNSTEVRPSGSSDRSVAVDNPFAQMFAPLASEWLRSSRLVSPLAESTWFLCHKSNRSAPLLLSFVGSDTPKIDTFDRDPNYLGIRMRAKLSFGSALMDPRSIIKSKGSA